jgi:hypothetical protein
MLLHLKTVKMSWGFLDWDKIATSKNNFMRKRSSKSLMKGKRKLKE